jgi:hypothetical protein
MHLWSQTKGGGGQAMSGWSRLHVWYVISKRSQTMITEAIRPIWDHVRDLALRLALRAYKVVIRPILLPDS